MPAKRSFYTPIAERRPSLPHEPTTRRSTKAVGEMVESLLIYELSRRGTAGRWHALLARLFQSQRLIAGRIFAGLRITAVTLPVAAGLLHCADGHCCPSALSPVAAHAGIIARSGSE